MISSKTARVHVSHTLRRIEAPNRLEAAAIAHRLDPAARRALDGTGRFTQRMDAYARAAGPFSFDQLPWLSHLSRVSVAFERVTGGSSAPAAGLTGGRL